MIVYDREIIVNAFSATRVTNNVHLEITHLTYTKQQNPMANLLYINI